MDQTLPCPDCGTAIHFETSALFQGRHYTCPACKADIALAQSGRATFQDAATQLAKLRTQLKKDGGAA
ncbi:hypothetical protein FIU85_21405 (plasmid) [Roseovarius sp. THAF8]|nr:hypothetical protein FIU85_21405 [Roseovarius sp. THAF8]